MRVQVDDKEFDTMLEYDQIKKRIRLISIQLNVDYENKVPVFVCVLNGSFMFMADLLKEVNISSEITFIRVSSYDGDATTRKVKKILGLDKSLKGRDVIIVEDIVDTGITLTHILAELKKDEPASINVCTLLLKPKCLESEIKEITYVGFEIPDDFVVGYGLDYNQLGRHLKDIYRVVPVSAET